MISNTINYASSIYTATANLATKSAEKVKSNPIKSAFTVLAIAGTAYGAYALSNSSSSKTPPPVSQINLSKREGSAACGLAKSLSAATVASVAVPGMQPLTFPLLMASFILGTTNCNADISS